MNMEPRGDSPILGGGTPTRTPGDEAMRRLVAIQFERVGRGRWSRSQW
jgi:hypothetical protein